MKKVCLFLMVLLLTIPCMVSSAPDQNEDIFTQSYMMDSGLAEQGIKGVQLVDWSGDTCYAYLADMSVHTYRSDKGLEKLCQLPESPKGFDQAFVIIDKAAHEQLQETVTYIAAGDDGLYGYNVYNGKFGSIDRNGIHWNDTLMDMECLNPNDELFPNRVARSLLTEKRLYTFVSAYWNDCTFFGFDRLSGKATEYKVDNAVGVCHEQGENFLFLRRLEDGYYISRLETDTNTLTDLSLAMDFFPASATVGGLAYDPTSEAICLAMKGQVYRSIAGGNFEPFAYIPTETLMVETPAWMLPDGRYALCTMTGMYIRTETKAMNHRQLVIRADGFTTYAEEIFRERYPDVELNFIRGSTTPEEVTQMLITQSDNVDVFEVCADYTFSSLVKKGFAADLSASAIIQSEVASMEPAFAAVIRDEHGHIIAYPTELRIWSSGIHEGYWRLVFGDRRLPTNMDEMLDAWIDWEVEYAEKYPDMEFTVGFDYAQFCQKIITFFIQQNDIPNGQPDINAPALRNILGKLQQVYEVRTQNGRRTTETTPTESENIASIVRFRAWDHAMNEPSTTVSLTSDRSLYGLYMWDYTKVPISFSEDDMPKTDGTLFVYVVNPYSRNMDAAIRFIECVSELESEPYIYYAIHPNYTQPYEWPSFQNFIQSAVREKAVLEEAKEKMADMDSATLRDIQAMIDYYEQYLENQENERWMISAQTIASQRKLLETVNLHTNSLYLSAPGTAAERMIAELCVRYADGNMTLDALLNELGNKMRLMQLEDR